MNVVSKKARIDDEKGSQKHLRIGLTEQSFVQTLFELPSSFVVDLLINIAIGAMTFILGLSAKKAYNYVKIRRPFLKVWGFRSGIPLYIVTGNIEPEATKSTFMEAGDIHAFAEIISSLKREYKAENIKSFFSRKYPRTLLDENIVSIGGPVFNSITKSMLNVSKSPFSFDLSTLNLIDNISEEIFSHTRVDDKIVRDFGVVIKIPNPHDDSRTVVIIAGCTTYGVLAGARSMSSLDRFGVKTLSQIAKTLGKNKFFALILEAEVIEGYVSPKIFRLYVRKEKETSWKKVI